MYRVEDRRKAVELRLKGLSYGEIKKQINVTKSVLSYWLSDYPLSKEHKKRLFDNRGLQIERFRETMAKKREERTAKFFEEIELKLKKVSNRDLLVAGAFLYWGEGQKAGTSVSVSNTNPEIIKFVIKWLEECFGVRRSTFRIYLHLYSDMNIDQEIKFWMKELSLERASFARPYIKTSTRTSLDYKSFGHGTCRIQLSNVKIKGQIMAVIGFVSGQGPSFNGRTRLL